jgi:hypothetical protein
MGAWTIFRKISWVHVFVESAIITFALVLAFEYDRWRSESDDFGSIERFTVAFVTNFIVMTAFYALFTHSIYDGRVLYAPGAIKREAIENAPMTDAGRKMLDTFKTELAELRQRLEKTELRESQT